MSSSAALAFWVLGLQQLGLEGERAILLYPPGLEFVTAFFGCLAAGVIAVPTHAPRPNRPPERIRAMLEDARPRVILTTAALGRRSGHAGPRRSPSSTS